VQVGTPEAVDVLVVDLDEGGVGVDTIDEGQSLNSRRKSAALFGVGVKPGQERGSAKATALQKRPTPRTTDARLE
jgi:hypothetical protein